MSTVALLYFNRTDKRRRPSWDFDGAFDTVDHAERIARHGCPGEMGVGSYVVTYSGGIEPVSMRTGHSPSGLPLWQIREYTILPDAGAAK